MKHRSRPRKWKVSDIPESLWMLLYAVCLFVLVARGELGYFVNPKYHWLTLGGAIAVYVLAMVLLALKAFRVDTEVRRPPGGELRRAAWLVLTSLPFVLVLVLGASPLSMSGAQADLTLLDQSASQPSGQELSGNDTSTWQFEDWYYACGAESEPSVFSGRPVDVTGLAMTAQGLPDGYIVVARYLITCCAADAVPIGFPVQVPEGQQAPTGGWVRVRGTMDVGVIKGAQTVSILAEEVSPVEAPGSPYIY